MIRTYRGIVIASARPAKRFGSNQHQFEIVEGGVAIRSYSYYSSAAEAEEAAKRFLDALMHKLRIEALPVTPAKRTRL